MIVVRLKGGLGNQMFQYAAGRALALRRGVDLALDNRVYEDRGPCALDVFNIRTVPPPVGRLPPRDKTWAMRMLRSGPRTMWTRRERRGQVFDPRVLNFPDNSYLQGYFQDARYFADFVDAIRAELSFRTPPDPLNATWLERISNAGHPVSVHVRRGDFASLGLMQPGAYFRDAMAQLSAEISSPTFFVFSDDPAWCRETFSSDVTVLDHNGPDRGHEDLRLMAACRSHILTPRSTFSRWGRWLAGGSL